MRFSKNWIIDISGLDISCEKHEICLELTLTGENNQNHKTNLKFTWNDNIDIKHIILLMSDSVLYLRSICKVY